MSSKVIDLPVSGTALSAAHDQVKKEAKNDGHVSAENGLSVTLARMRENLLESLEGRATKDFSLPASMQKTSSFKNLKEQVRTISALTNSLHGIALQGSQCDTANAMKKLDEIVRNLEKVDAAFVIE